MNKTGIFINKKNFSTRNIHNEIQDIVNEYNARLESRKKTNKELWLYINNLK